MELFGFIMEVLWLKNMMTAVKRYVHSTPTKAHFGISSGERFNSQLQSYKMKPEAKKFLTEVFI